ncbi:MAG: outer membrane protein assembly factor BamD [Epsilonproteobacteria bacterium]|nr:MAG: outer membrane protein assembly factor BamD [Campylobacterota bacterium]
MEGNNMKKSLWVLIVTMFVFVGCAKKDEVSDYNKPAIHWYKKIAESITKLNLDKADEYYLSLKSEHMRSPLLPTAIIMLAHGHMESEEYLMANYYFDEYNKRFATSDGREYADFMKLKSAFLGISDINKEQKLMLDTVKNAEKFVLRHPGSPYDPLVKTILVRLHMSQYLLNENIAALYNRIDKDKGAKIYRTKNDQSPLNLNDIDLPKKGIFSKVFD